METEGSLPCSQQPATFPILSHMNPVHIFPLYFPNIQARFLRRIIMAFQSMRRSSELSLPFRFSNQNSECISHLSHVCYMPRPSHPPWFHHQWYLVKGAKTWKSSLCSLLHPRGLLFAVISLNVHYLQLISILASFAALKSQFTPWAER